MGFTMASIRLAIVNAQGDPLHKKYIALCFAPFTPGMALQVS